MIDIDALAERLNGLWIPAIYSEKIRPMRTRSFSLPVPERVNAPEIIYTLLGIELKVGKTRIACPDLSTARYLMVFARIGSRHIAIPYDISKLSAIADELETAWQRLMLLLGKVSVRDRNMAVKKIRAAIDVAGAGSSMPAFDTPTRKNQRK